MSQTVRIIIPANDYHGSLRRCLNAIVDTEAEVVVVADGWSDDFPNRFRQDFPNVDLRVGNFASAGMARNAGAEGFSGEVIVFLDADVIPEPGALDRIVAPIHSGSAEATTGRYLDDVAFYNFAQRYKQAYLSVVYARRKHLRNEFWTAFSAISREAFEAVGGFCPSFRGACGEDTEFGHRLTQHGCQVQSVPEAQGAHLKSFTVPGLIQNDFRKGVMSFRLKLSGETQLNDFRHSTRRDVLAVLLTGLMGLTALGSLVLPWVGLALTALGLGAYAITRADLIRAFLRRRGFFILRAVPMMLTLDVVRGTCVVVAVAQERLLPRWRALRRLSTDPVASPSASSINPVTRP